MNGHKPFLSPKKRIVIDTHVLQAAINKEKHNRHPVEQPSEETEREDDAYELLTEVIKNSPKLVFSPEQWKEATAHASFRQPARFDIIRELDEKDKLVKINASKLKKLPSSIENSLKNKRGRKQSSSKTGHHAVSDDIHLFMAAMATDKTLITEDENILSDKKRIKLILDETGVRVFSVRDALELHESTK